MHPSAGATTSKARESSKPKDKWANYTSAKDLGFTDEADKTAYEVEQEVKGRAANAPGAWQVVVDPQAGLDEEEDDGQGIVEGSWGGKRKLGEYAVEDDEKAEGEEFKFAHRDKRPVRDPYDEDDWDPKAALGGLKFKSKDKGLGGTTARVKSEEEIKREQEGALDRAKWTGRLELNKVETTPSTAETKPKQEGLAYVDGGWNKVEDAQDTTGSGNEATQSDSKPVLDEDVKPDLPESHEPVSKDESKVTTTKTTEAVAEDVKPDVSAPVSDPAPPSSLFKKRRPPPSNRKK
jgi:WW domain-binding protein 4